MVGVQVRMAVLQFTLLAALAQKEIAFKLKSGLRKDKEASLAVLVANISGLSPPKRIFRHAGKFEQRHVNFGLDRWYTARAKKLPEDALKMLQQQTSFISTSSVYPAHRLVDDASHKQMAAAEVHAGSRPWMGSNASGTELHRNRRELAGGVLHDPPNDPFYPQQTSMHAVNMQGACLCFRSEGHSCAPHRER